MPTSLSPTSSAASKGKLTGGKVLVLLLAFFGIIIGVNALMTVLAITTLSGTEVASAYSASLAYTNEIEASRLQDARHWTVIANANRTATSDLEVTLDARDARGAPIDGVFSLQLERPVDKRQDRRAVFSALGAGHYVAHVTDVALGSWDLSIEAAENGAVLFRSKNRLFLN